MFERFDGLILTTGEGNLAEVLGKTPI